MINNSKNENNLDGTKNTSFYVPEHRKETFKSRYMDRDCDRRKKRNEELQGIRRQRRDLKMSKLRSIKKVENESEDEDEVYYNEDDSSYYDRFICINENNIGELKNRLYSDCIEDQWYAVKLIRDVLSDDNEDPPIQTVLDWNLLPRLVQLLNSNDDSRILFETAWAITNIASGTSAQTKALVDNEGIPALVGVLKKSVNNNNNKDYILANQVIWALGNIAGEYWQYRDWILELDICPIISELTKNNNLPPDQNVTWALTNFCRGQELESQWGKLRSLLPDFKRLLYLGENSGVCDIAWALYGLCSTIKEPAIHSIQQNFLDDLCNLLDTSRSVTVRIPVLRTIGTILDCPQRIDTLCQNYGILARIETILNDSNCTSLYQDAFFVLSHFAQHGTANQVCYMLQRNIGYILRILNYNISDINTKIEACWVIRNALMNREINPQLAQLNLVDKGVISPLCGLLEPKADNLVLKLSLESLRQVLRNGHAKMTDGINVLAVYIEQLGGIDKLNSVIFNSRNNEIYELARSLLDTYFRK